MENEIVILFEKLRKRSSGEVSTRKINKKIQNLRNEKVELEKKLKKEIHKYEECDKRNAYSLMKLMNIKMEKNDIKGKLRILDAEHKKCKEDYKLLVAKSINLQIEMGKLANENKVLREKIRTNKMTEEFSDTDT